MHGHRIPVTSRDAGQLETGRDPLGELGEVGVELPSGPIARGRTRARGPGRCEALARASPRSRARATPTVPAAHRARRWRSRGDAASRRRPRNPRPGPPWWHRHRRRRASTHQRVARGEPQTAASTSSAFSMASTNDRPSVSSERDKLRRRLGLYEGNAAAGAQHRLGGRSVDQRHSTSSLARTVAVGGAPETSESSPNTSLGPGMSRRRPSARIST